MIYWNLEEKKLALAYNWKISRNESTFKTNFIIRISGPDFTALGETAPNIRYGETPEKIRQEFDEFLQMEPERVETIEVMQLLLNSLNISNSLRFGIESAFIHYLCISQKRSIYELLQLPVPSGIFTSYTIPIMEPSAVKDFIERHKLHRFKSLKIKVNTDGLDLITACRKHYEGPLWIDANEAWTDVEAVIPFIEKLKSLNVTFVEQPLPHHMTDEYIYLKQHTSLPLIGDESITNTADFDLLSRQFHGVNVKLMKAGGYINGRDMLINARKHGMKTMIGCMIETTIGISSGMHLCGLTDYVDLDGYFVISEEPYGLVKETDGRLELA